MLKKINLPESLLIIFLIAWIFFAIDPLYRFDWVLENIVIFLGLPIVIFSYFKFRLSNFSYFLIFLFAILHIMAAHYTYGSTPWGNWLSEIFNWERNHYDRIVHFIYGFLMSYISIEILYKYVTKRKIINYLLTFSIIVAVGAIYEIAEFIVGIYAKPGAGLAFLGFQGDIWDTQKDMLLQLIGVVIGIFTFNLFRK